MGFILNQIFCTTGQIITNARLFKCRSSCSVSPLSFLLHWGKCFKHMYKIHMYRLKWFLVIYCLYCDADSLQQCGIAHPLYCLDLATGFLIHILVHNHHVSIIYSGCDLLSPSGLWYSHLHLLCYCCFNLLFLLLQTKGKPREEFKTFSSQRNESDRCVTNVMLVLSQTRRVEISYMNGDLPVNHIVLTGQSDSSVSSVMYLLPAAHGSVPSAPLPNYSPVPNVPPPAYDQVSYAPPSNYGPVPNEPPPAYEVIRSIFE